MELILVGDFDFLLPKFGEGIDVLINLRLALGGLFIADSGSDYSSISLTKLKNRYVPVILVII